MAFIELEHLAVPPWIDITPYIPEVAEKDRIRSCVILGSFGKFHDQINETIGYFEDNGIHVLARCVHLLLMAKDFNYSRPTQQ